MMLPVVIAVLVCNLGCLSLYGINIQLHARYFWIFVFLVVLSGEPVCDEQI